MKTIIAGSRWIKDYALIDQAMASAVEIGILPTEICCGEAEGVDELGGLWAIADDLPITKFPARWKLYGKRAGPIRNQHMAKYADAAVIIWDGKSPGTKNMIYWAKKWHLKTYLHNLETGYKGPWPIDEEQEKPRLEV